MDKRKFTLSNEEVNSYGFKVLTSGIDLKRFTKNPVMLFQHNHEKVMGKWTDIKVEGTELTAIPEFDPEDPEAVTLSGKVDRGFINGASIGMQILEVDTTGEIPIVTKSELMETSVVSVPSNGKALQVVDQYGQLMSEADVLTRLSIKGKAKSNNTDSLFKSKLAHVLGIDNGSEDEILKEVNTLKNEPIETELKAAILDGRIKANEKDTYHKLLRNDLSHGRKVLGSLQPKSKLPIEHGKSGNKSDWTLSDYRKKAPNELRDNPELYQQLIEKESKK